MIILKLIAAIFAGIVFVFGGLTVAAIVLAFWEARDANQKEGDL